MTTKYTTLPAAQRAADRSACHIRLLREWHQHRIASLEHELNKVETKLEEAREAFGVFEAKGDMAAKMQT